MIESSGDSTSFEAGFVRQNHIKLISHCMEEDLSHPQTGPIVSTNKALRKLSLTVLTQMLKIFMAV
jgi:hypothetical protein